MKRAAVAAFLLVLLAAAGVLTAPRAEAAWNPAGEVGEATYQVLPLEGKVHATLSFRMTNLDEDTRGTGAYYYTFAISVHPGITNVKAYDQNRPLVFTTVPGGSWTILALTYNTELIYGRQYSFTVEYDLPGISRAVASFWASGQTNTATVRILLPKGYYDEVSLSQTGYTLGETAEQTVYTYVNRQDGWRFSTLVNAVRKAPEQTLSGTARLKQRETIVVVNYWEGEEEKARQLLDLGIKALPLLEEITSVPFPPDYPVIVKESTFQDTRGWDGINRGIAGILIPAPNVEDKHVVLHEMAHYWAAEPPFGEAWMREGHAELYAYIALQKLGYSAEAEDMKTTRFKRYQQGLGQYDQPLSGWEPPERLTPGTDSMVAFMYSKSFVFMLGLYEEYGLASIQKSNQAVFARGRAVDWFDYLGILEAVTGQELKQRFTTALLPPSLTQSFERWQATQKAYQEAEQTISTSRGALGIESVERELQAARDLLTTGQLDQALTQIQSTLSLYQKWQATEKAYRQTEQTISTSKGGVGIETVEKELQAARDLLSTGQLDQALTRVQSALSLYQKWQAAEKAYREAEQTIASSKDTLGIETMERELQAARDLLSTGQLDQALARVQSTLSLYQKWQATEKAYREAEQATAGSRGAVGIETVEKELQAARDLLSTGQLDQALAGVQSALGLYQKWQAAERAYREAGQTIAAARQEGRTWRLGNAETIALKAKDLLEQGEFEASLAQAETARDRASRVVTPLEGIAAMAAPYILALGGLVVILVGWRLLRKRPRAA